MKPEFKRYLREGMPVSPLPTLGAINLSGSGISA
jgi:hypothetical protein